MSGCHIATLAGSRVLTPTAPSSPNSLKRLNRLHVPETADVALVGDSLVAGWPADLLAGAFPGRSIFNFGLPGDRVQNVLWRLDAVQTGHLRPHAAVLLVGTNNVTDGDPPDAIAAGVVRVAEWIGDVWGSPRLVLITPPARAAGLLAWEGDRRTLNACLADAAGRLGARLVHADAALAPAARAAFEPDLLHLSREGYRCLTAALANALSD